MKNKYFASLLLLLFMGGSVMAQQKEKLPPDSKEDIIIRKKADAKGKITIVIDGDNITVNGKPLSELSNSDIQVLRDKAIANVPRFRKKAMDGMDVQSFKDMISGNATRPLLGVSSEKNEKGAKILEVSKESPAEKAGLQKDDIITAIDGKHTVSSPQDLYETITNNYHPGDKITVSYLRNGKAETATAVLGKTEMPKVQAFNFNGDDFKNFNFDMPQLRGLNNMNGGNMRFVNKPKLGMEIQDLEEGKGVKVTGITEGGAAARAGLQKNDIIMELDGEAVTSVDELRSQVSNIKEGDTLRVVYKRDGKSMNTELKFPRKLKTAEL